MAAKTSRGSLPEGGLRKLNLLLHGSGEVFSHVPWLFDLGILSFASLYRVGGVAFNLDEPVLTHSAMTISGLIRSVRSSPTISWLRKHGCSKKMVFGFFDRAFTCLY